MGWNRRTPPSLCSTSMRWLALEHQRSKRGKKGPSLLTPEHQQMTEVGVRLSMPLREKKKRGKRESVLHTFESISGSVVNRRFSVKQIAKEEKGEFEILLGRSRWSREDLLCTCRSTITGRKKREKFGEGAQPGCDLRAEDMRDQKTYGRGKGEKNQLRSSLTPYHDRVAVAF